MTPRDPRAAGTAAPPLRGLLPLIAGLLAWQLLGPRVPYFPPPFEWLRAMFISMMMDRALAVVNIANFIHFLETSTPGSGRHFRI